MGLRTTSPASSCVSQFRTPAQKRASRTGPFASKQRVVSRSAIRSSPEDAPRLSLFESRRVFAIRATLDGGDRGRKRGGLQEFRYALDCPDQIAWFHEGFLPHA